MADKKISQLPVATTPLAGTEVLPIVQSSTTDQVSVANLTAGRVPAMNNAAMGFTSTASAAGTTTLTATSNHVQKLTGSATQTYKLPDATTMAAGTAFIFDNNSTGLLTVVDNASGAVTTVASGSIQYVYLMTNATAAGTWGKYSWVSGAGALAVTTAKSASITNSLTFSGTDSTTMTFPTTSATIARTDAAQNFVGNNTFDTTTLAIDATNDKVGIGTITPSTKLNIKFAPLTSGTQINELVLQSNANSVNNSFNALTGITFYNRTDPVVYSAGSFNSTSGVYGINLDDAVYGRNMGLVFYTSARDAPALERMRIDSSGNTTLNTGNLVIGTSGKGVSLPGNVTWTSGTNSPEGVVTAPVGSLYSRTNGGAGTSLYVKESGTGNTGWVGK